MAQVKNYGYHLIGSTVIDNNSGCNTIKDLKERISETFGTGVKFEYWSACGGYSGEAKT